MKPRKQLVIPSPLNHSPSWSADCPAPSVDVIGVQRDIDAIVGVSRGKSIAKLVWNGDTRYWKDLCLDWNLDGSPKTFIKRPYVLYRSIWSQHNKLLYDIPVPRWLILTRIEPEQYVPGWAASAYMFAPEKGRTVQVKPLTPPDEWYVWFMTIADHNAQCCKIAAKQNRTCYGIYAHPRKALDELGRVMQSVKASGIKDAPFDAPDELTANLRHDSVNNYMEQAIRRYQEQASQFIGSIGDKAVREFALEEAKRGLDRVAQDQQNRILRG